jgi:hypothetical protein
MISRSLMALGVGLAVLATSCKEGPASGEFSVDLTTPNADDGAIQFTATATPGNTITQISQGCAGCKLFVVKVSDVQYRGVLTGNIGTGTLFRIGVSDTKRPSNFSVQIVAVSNRTFAVRGTLNGYVVTLR